MRPEYKVIWANVAESDLTNKEFMFCVAKQPIKHNQDTDLNPVDPINPV